MRTRWSLNTEAIDRARILNGWTQNELAHRARVDPGTVCDMLNLRRRPTFATIQAVRSVLGLELEDVIRFRDPSVGGI